MKLIATIDFLRGDVGLKLFESLGLPLYRTHYSHHTATKEVFQRFTERIVKPVTLITDGSRLRGEKIFPDKYIVSELPDIDSSGSPSLLNDIALSTTKDCVTAFKRKYDEGGHEVLWVHFFRLTHWAPVWQDYNYRAYQVVQAIKELIDRCPGDWIVSADHGIAKDNPMRRLCAETLYVPLASNCLPANDGYTNHDMLAQYINTGDFSGSWETLECYDSFQPGCPRHTMTQDGTLIAVDSQVIPSTEDIHNRLKALGYA